MMYEVVRFFQDGWDMLVRSWWVKVILAFIAQLAIWLIHLKHFQILGIFTILVFLDLFTKWGAVSYQMLKEEGLQDVGMKDKYWGIVVAFKRGLISSKHWRTPFIKKILTYVLATAGATCFDIMGATGNYATHLIWLYLGSCEFFSILENLRDGGNEQIGAFLILAEDKIKTKLRG